VGEVGPVTGLSGVASRSLTIAPEPEGVNSGLSLLLQKGDSEVTLR